MSSNTHEFEGFKTNIPDIFKRYKDAELELLAYFGAEEHLADDCTIIMFRGKWRKVEKLYTEIEIICDERFRTWSRGVELRVIFRKPDYCLALMKNSSEFWFWLLETERELK